MQSKYNLPLGNDPLCIIGCLLWNQTQFRSEESTQADNNFPGTQTKAASALLV